MTQRNTNETLLWLRNDRRGKRLIWRGLCQKRVRSARNLPAVYPSAFAAMMATPMSERVYDLSKITRGMVGYADDPNDSNKFGHVYTFVGRDDSGTLLVDTNDALVSGGGSVVPYDWFESHWGDPYVFAATSCNGFDLILPKPKDPAPEPEPKHPKPEKKATAANFDYALHRLGKALAYHEKHKHPVIVRRLRKEIEDLKTLRRMVLNRGR